MKYDFDTVIDRTRSDSVKWMGLGDFFGEQDLLPLWVADMDFQSPAPVVEAMVARAQHGIYGYPWRTSTFYDPLISWMAKRHGWEIQREWIVNAPGVVTALVLAIQALTHPGDKIVIQPPVYHPFSLIVRNHGRQLVENRLKYEGGDYRMDLEDLERQIDSRTRLLILCSPHNPVGRVWTREELEALADVCVRKNIVVLSDEIHCDLILRGHKHIPFAALSPEIARRTLTFIAPSKTFNIAGLATSTVIASDPDLRAAIKSKVEDYGLDIGNDFGVTALPTAFREGEEWLDQVMVYIEGNIDFASRFVEQNIPRVKLVRPEGTYLLWLDCRGLGMDGVALKNWMIKQARVALVDGADFGPGGEGFQRVNVACPRAILAEGLKRIATAASAL